MSCSDIMGDLKSVQKRTKRRRTNTIVRFSEFSSVFLTHGTHEMDIYVVLYIVIREFVHFTGAYLPFPPYSTLLKER